MGDRRQSRELALQVLFSLDLGQFDFDQSDLERGLADFCDQKKEDLTSRISPFFLELVNGVMENKENIDRHLKKASRNWKLSRMPVVDRNIMRVAVFELLHKPDIPASVTINEAVEIGKKFGTRDSGPFINGILDRIRVETR